VKTSEIYGRIVIQYAVQCEGMFPSEP